jgi:hypothetical protein
MGSTGGKIVRIGGAAGALNDSAIAVPQLLSVPGLNYLAFDYLGEAAMGMLAKMRQADPASGFLPDFLDVHLGEAFSEIARLGVKVVTNAGGMNPAGLAQAIRARAEKLGLSLTVAAVEGDDLLPIWPELSREGLRDMFSGAPIPPRVGSANAYLGAFPIADALAAGADIVVAGRVVDSALILGPLIHEFGWCADDYDRLAAGTAAGHLLECGAQATGGTFTDWREAPDWDGIGFPVAECHADGSFTITKPAGTGGLVSRGTIAEQLLYEVGDPQAYIAPDVTCDFSQIRLEEIGPDRVRVSGARGYPPTAHYKVSVTYEDGWRSVSLQPIIGVDAPAKARRQAEAILKRTSAMLRERDLAPWRRTHVEVIGAEASYGPHARPIDTREVICKIVVDHDEARATDLFWREQSSAIMNMAVGGSLPLVVATPRSLPLSHLTSCLVDKERVPAFLRIGGERRRAADSRKGGFEPSMLQRPPPPPAPADAATPVPLIALAWARSGDKGDLFNVGVIARRPENLPYIRAALTPQAVADWYRHLFADPAHGRVDVYDAPGFDAINLVAHASQAGGINISPRLDPGAKAMAQLLLEFPVPVSPAIAAAVPSGTA